MIDNKIEEKKELSKKDKIQLFIVIALTLIFIVVFGYFFQYDSEGIKYVNITTCLHTSDVDYTFNEVELYNGELPSPIQDWNVRNQTESLFYDGTFDFNSTFIDYVTSNATGSSCYIRWEEVYDGHSGLLRMFDGSSSFLVNFDYDFTNEVASSIQFWIHNSDWSKPFNIYLYNGATSVIRIWFQSGSGNFRMYDNLGYDAYTVSLTDNTWQYVEINFECSAFGWMDLNQYEYQVLIDNVEVDTQSFQSNQPYVNTITHTTTGTLSGNTVRIDSMLHTWNNSRWDNYKPIYVSNNSLESDLFEFTFDSSSIPYAIGDNSIDGWSITETNGYCQVGVDDDDDFDKLMEFYSTTKGSEINMTREITTDDSDYVYINTTIENDGFSQSDGNDLLNFYLYDSFYNQILRVFIWSQTTYHVIAIKDDTDTYIAQDTIYNTEQFDVDLIIEIYYNNVTINYNGTIYKYEHSHGDLAKIQFLKEWSATSFYDLTCYSRIDYVGIYINGESESIELTPNNVYPVNLDWSLADYPFIEMTFNDSYTNHVKIYANTELLYKYTYFPANFLDMKFDNSTLFPSFYFQILNDTSYELLNIRIYGISLNDGSDDYHGYITTNNVGDDSFFYVSSNSLSYNFTADDTKTEYIQIEFSLENIYLGSDILHLTCSNFNILGKEFRINYLDSTTSILEIGYGYESLRSYLPEKTLDSVVFLITDDDTQDNYNGSGYFKNLSFKGYSTDDISIVTSDFLTAMIPFLFLIVTPALVVVSAFKRTKLEDMVPDKLFLILIVIFSFVSYIYAEIDLWMIFLMIFGFITLFLGNRSDK